ncbi:MAG: glycosyltransferase family 4 protein [Acidimicrobiales bacterium]
MPPLPARTGVARTGPGLFAGAVRPAWAVRPTRGAPVTAVHQITPAFLERDAVGAHVVEVQRTLRALGLESEIYVENLHPATAGASHLLSELPTPRHDGGTVLIYQFATGSDAGEVAYDRPEPLVVNYHNLTPPEHYQRWNRGVVVGLNWARVQLKRLGERAALGIGVSEYNTAELVQAGFASTAVAPILFNPASFEGDPDPATLERLQAAKANGGSDWLFVGRLTPNKAQQDLVKALAAYREVYDPKARLHLVGRADPAAFGTAMHRFVAEAGLTDAVEIADEGVPADVLRAHFAAADVFTCASEHEGFCVPLVEAMHHQVPIVAYAAAAVPETLSGGGLALVDKAPLTMATAVHRVLSDPDLHAQLAAGAAVRLEELSLERSRAKLIAALAPLTGISGPKLW